MISNSRKKVASSPLPFSELFTALETKAVFEPATSERTFRVAMSDYCVHVYLPKVVRILSARAPQLRLMVENVFGPSFSRLEGGDIDMVIFRENTEGEYSSVGGKMYEGTEREIVIQETVMSRTGVDRVLKYAFDLAQTRPRKKLTSATKSNGISITMPYWDERVAEMAKQYPEIAVDKFHIDILTANFVLHPDWFDVVVGSNLFGDILSDLGPACTGTIGIAPSANINPEGKFPSLFEPVHGSAPDIAGKGIANPIGQIWSGAMMLEHLGYKEAGDAMVEAIEAVLGEGDSQVLTRDVGGQGTTESLGKAIADRIGG